MQFRLNEDQLALDDSFRKIVSTDRIQPRVRAVVDGKTAWDEETWREIVDFGLTAMIVPEDYQGIGLSMVELAVAAETLGYTAAAVPFFGHSLATVAILHGGSEAQKQAWLPKLASGEIVASVAISDSNDGWAPSEWTMELAEGKISGRKINVPGGVQADLLVVALKGGQLGLVETNADGVTVEALDALDVTRPIASVSFDGASVELLENGPQGAERLFDAALVLLAADGFGGAMRIVEMTRDYMLVREAFGAKLAEFQGIKHQAANMVLEVEPTRGLYWWAAYAFANVPDKASHAASQAKAMIGEVYVKTVRLGTEMHGGIGFTWEYDSHIWFKRAMLNYAWGGRPEKLFLRSAELSGW